MLALTPQSVVRATAAMSLMVCLAGATLAADYVPWALRDFYSFKGANADFSVAVKTAEWKVDIEGIGTVVNDVQAEVQLAGGDTFRLAELDYDRDTRKEIVGPFGKSSVFTFFFKPRNGLVVSYSVARFVERPFMLINLNIENTGETPISLEAIRPVVVPPGGISNLGANVGVSQLRSLRRGEFPVLHDSPHASLVRFSIPDRGVTLALGILQSGKMDSHVDLVPVGDTWQGMVECNFIPPITLSQGERVEADPVWLSSSLPEPERVHQFYSWSVSAFPQAVLRRPLPDGWITVAKGENVESLYDAARRWKGSKVNHVLIPGTWEGRPGSFEGAEPYFPRNMRNAARELQDLGMQPGITIDPLVVDGADSSWSAKSVDGTEWLNPSDNRARAFAVDRVRKAVNWGFNFFVVQPSLIPDEVLSFFDITRAQADSQAFEIVMEAAPDLTVLPSSEVQLDANSPQWNSLADETDWFYEYGVSAGPVRVNVDGVKQLSPAIIAALREFHGPVEFVGKPSSELRQQLDALFSEGP